MKGPKLHYEIKNQSVIFFLDNPKGTAGNWSCQSYADSRLNKKVIELLAESLIKKYQGQSYGSQRSITSEFLRPFFAFFKTTGTSWPTTANNWQIVIYNFFQFFLTDDSWGNSKTRVRMRKWQTVIGTILEYLIDEEIIPRGTRIPKIRQKKIQSLATDQPILGQSHLNIVGIDPHTQKLLVDINFGKTDAEYLDEVEKKCRELVDVVHEVCVEHWDGLMRDGETGRRLALQVTDTEINEAIRIGRFGSLRKTGGKPTRFASPSHQQGIAWALAIINQNLANGFNKDCISLKTLRASPFFPKRLCFTNTMNEFYAALDDLTALNSEQWQALPLPARFYRFTGLLSNIDAAAACCLMTIEHPELTSESLQNAKLLNVRGKPVLLLTDSIENSILSLDKPRSGTRKSIVLTPLSQKLVIDILRSTASVREILKRVGDKNWRYLFLGVIQSKNSIGFLGTLSGSSQHLHSGQRSIGLTKLYPALSQNGLTKGCFDFRRLRNTLGVIRWFETGSILEMSRRLGNSRRVALEHYLPPALLHAWNTRIIRRFQNTIIVLAAHDEPYLLDVTDFSTMSDLQCFIAQLITDYPKKTSILADEVQSRLGSEQGINLMSAIPINGILNIRLSPTSLGLLYSFSDLALQTMDSHELIKVDALSGLAPKQFTDMATLLRHSVENGGIHSSLRELLNMPLLTQIHYEALTVKNQMGPKFTQLAIRRQWMGGK